MSIRNAKSAEGFVTLLSAAATHRDMYLKKDGDNFLLTYERSAKNINTKDIVKTAQSCFELFQDTEDKTQSDRLTLALKSYLLRVENSIPLYTKLFQKIFGKSSSQRALEAFAQQAASIGSKPILHHQDKTDDLSIFYHKLFDEPRLTKENVSRLSMQESINLIIEDLIHHCGKSSKMTPETLKLIGDLEFAQLLITHPDLEHSKIINRFKISSEVIIPNRSSLLILKKNDNGSFSLTNQATKETVENFDINSIGRILQEPRETSQNPFKVVMGYVQEKVGDPDYHSLQMSITARIVDGLSSRALSTDQKIIIQLEAQRVMIKHWTFLKSDEQQPTFLNVSNDQALKLFYHKVLDSQTERKGISGSIPALALATITSDLNRFAHSDLVSEPGIYDSLINELNFASFVSFCVLYRLKDINSLSKQIVDRIGDLQVGEYVIIPGGTRSHAVLYKIEKEQDGTLSFQTFNTGEATHKINLNQYRDLIYTDLTASDFSQEFIETLLQAKYDKGSMSEVNSLINFKLQKEIDNIKYGSPSQIQKHGSCTVKCVQALLHHRLTPQDYRRYKAMMTASEISRFKDLSIEKSNEFIKGLMDSPLIFPIHIYEYIRFQIDTYGIRREAQEVLERRQRKAVSS